MEVLHLDSKLTEKQIAENFKDFDLFGSLVESLEEAVDYAKGHKRDTTWVRKRELTIDRDKGAEDKA